MLAARNSINLAIPAPYKNEMAVGKYKIAAIDPPRKLTKIILGEYPKHDPLVCKKYGKKTVRASTTVSAKHAINCACNICLSKSMRKTVRGTSRPDQPY